MIDILIDWSIKRARWSC